MKTKLLMSFVLACALGSSACFTTRITFASAFKAQAPSIEWEEKWYHDAIFGLAELSGPVRLEQVCRDGVIEIEQETSFLSGLVEILTYRLYNPQVVTVYCASGAHAKVVTDARGEALAYIDDLGVMSTSPASGAQLTQQR